MASCNGLPFFIECDLYVPFVHFQNIY